MKRSGGMCVALLAASVSARAQLTDPFDSPFTYWDGVTVNVTGSIWNGLANTANASRVSAGNGPSGLLLIEANGNSSSSNPQNEPPFSAPFLYINATADFVASVQVDPTSCDADFENLGIAILSGPTTVAQVLSIFNMTAGSSTRFRGFDAGEVSGQFTDTTLYTWLRIERVGSLLRGYASHDGAAWIRLGILNDFLPSDVQVGLFAASANTLGAFAAPFDNFMFTPLCPGDYNRTGGPADVLDFLDFMDDFGGCLGVPVPCGAFGDPDVNGDTIVDVLDFLDYLDAFGTGC